MSLLQHVMVLVKEKRIDNPDQLTEDEITAWRYYKYSHKRKTFKSVPALVVYCELSVAKRTCPTRKQEAIRELDIYSKLELNVKHARLITKETQHGTPSCLCIRKYLKN